MLVYCEYSHPGLCRPAARRWASPWWRGGRLRPGRRRQLLQAPHAAADRTLPKRWIAGRRSGLGRTPPSYRGRWKLKSDNMINLKGFIGLGSGFRNVSLYDDYLLIVAACLPRGTPFA